MKFEFKRDGCPACGIEDCAIAAIEIAERFGSIDGEHHKQWVIDQMLRALLSDQYEAWVNDRNEDETYKPWDVGIAPCGDGCVCTPGRARGGARVDPTHR